jgi:glycosyltransferase involved in cell wall biosynthesis
MGISIFIQTLNEEQNLPGLLESVSWSDDIVVLDSFSSDRTREIAEQAGCRWYERKYDGRGTHQNWAMEHIDFKHPWVFYLDADERMTPQLRKEIEAIASDPDESRVAFYCGRKNFFQDKWLKYSMPPGYIMRFFQPPNIRFERLANPVPVVNGEVGYLKEHFIHYNFSKGLTEWFARHNKYSSYEAIETMKSLEASDFKAAQLFSPDPMARRFALKQLSFRMPMRPFFKFIYMYLLKRGFLDGGAGYSYCMMQAFFEYQICLKVKEMQRERTGLPPG